MSILSRLSRRFTRPANADQVGNISHGPINPGKRYSVLQAKGQRSQLIRLLARLAENVNLSGNDYVLFSRVLYEQMVLYKRSIHVYNSLLGKVVVRNNDQGKRFNDYVNSFVDEVAVLNQYESAVNANKCGLAAATPVMMTNIIRDGWAFYQDHYDLETAKFQGLMLLNPYDFQYQAQEDYYTLVFQGDQYPRLDSNMQHVHNPFFHVINPFTDTSDVYPFPMIRGSRMVADLAVYMLNAIKNQTNRFGNPAGFVVVQQKDLDLMDQNINPAGDLEGEGPTFVEMISDLQDDVEAALQASQQGYPMEVLTSLPGEVDIKSFTYGADFTNQIEHELFWKILSVFSNIFDIPPIFFGIRNGGGGIGSQEFETMFALTKANVNMFRSYLLGSFELSLYNYLLANGFYKSDLKGLLLEFEDISILGAKERAQIRQLNVQANASVLDAFERLLFLYPNTPDVALTYAEDQGIKLPKNVIPEYERLDPEG